MANQTHRLSIDLKTDRMIGFKEDGVGWITFNNPARRNAISSEMRIALLTLLDEFQADDDIRVIVMHGAGDKAFVSGSDISEFGEKRATAEQAANYQKLSDAVDAAFAGLRKPLIAMVRGLCLGAGLATALKADLRIASDDAQFGIPAARLGLVYNYAGTKRLVETIGPSRTMELIFTARRFNAKEALQCGLVNEVVPVDLLEARTRELARMICQNAPITVEAAKIITGEIMKDPDDRDLDLCDSLVSKGFASEDYKEGRAAFMEKRSPSFKGK